MEIKKRNLMINRAGGTAGRNSVNYRVSLPAPWIHKIGVNETFKGLVLEFDGDKIIIKKDVNDMIDKLTEMIESITKGERFINLDQLEEIEELEGAYVENCGISGTGRGTLYTIYLTDNDGDKTDEEIAEFVLEEEKAVNETLEGLTRKHLKGEIEMLKTSEDMIVGKGEYREVGKRTNYEVTKEEFLNLLGKEDAIVNIKRSEGTEFLFENKPTYLVNEATKYATLNLKFGLDNIGFTEKLDANDRMNDNLNIIKD